MERKRVLVWIESAGFMGWGCNLCSWKYQIPKASTSKAPSLETRDKFLHHRCVPPSKRMSAGTKRFKNGTVRSVAGLQTTLRKKMP